MTAAQVQGLHLPSLSEVETRMGNLIEQAREAGDWQGYLWYYPRRFRLDKFLEISRKVADAEYWRLLASTWIDTECPNQCRSLWLFLFTVDRPDRGHLMTAEEHEIYDALPDPVRIYRGTGRKYASGMSWTTSEDQAAWFARRSGADGDLLATVLPKKRVLACFRERKESEVVVDPRRIKYETLDRGYILAGAERMDAARKKGA